MRLKWEKRLREIEPEIRRWFHHLHQNPELGFEEFETSAFVEQKLKSFQKIEVRRIGSTGVLGIIKTEKKGPVLAFRADMDALPIEEDETHVVCSRNRGVMHACGHDGHTASLLGAAKILAEQVDQLCGEIRFLFQPSEEIQPGGAKSMVQGGALEGVDYIFGMHYSIDEEVGCFSIQEGQGFAANYKLDITVAGQEGHAAFPYLAKDAILCASELVCALNRIVSRGISPAEQVVLSVTEISGGNSYNSIPGEVLLKGTFRFLNRDLTERIIDKIRETGEGVCKANGCRFSWNFQEGCMPLYNEPVLTGSVRNILEESFGKSQVLNHEPVMGCEDFSEYLKKTKGVYFRTGAKTVEEDGTVYPTHNSGYHLNEEALLYGTGSIIEVLLGMMEQDKISET